MNNKHYVVSSSPKDAQSSNQNNSKTQRERNLIACLESGWCAHKLAYCSSWHTIGRGRKENEKDNRIVCCTEHSVHCTLCTIKCRFDPFIESSEQTTFSAWKNLFCDQNHIRKCTSNEWLFFFWRMWSIVECILVFNTKATVAAKMEREIEKKKRTFSHAKHCQRYLTDNEAILYYTVNMNCIRPIDNMQIMCTWIVTMAPKIGPIFRRKTTFKWIIYLNNIRITGCKHLVVFH